MAVKRSQLLAKVGFELMDKKRNILVSEMMSMIDDARGLQKEIDEVFRKAYLSLQRANVTMGIVTDEAECVEIDNSLDFKLKSVMGVEIPVISHNTDKPKIAYGFLQTNSMIDDAFVNFTEAKNLSIKLAQIETSIYRLAIAIKKTQKRANALKNIIIPDNEKTIKFITEALEEKEREEYTRLKVIKKMKE